MRAVAVTTPPTWMASPPEVHSASLSSGPGPGALHAAASAWASLSYEYLSAATELGSILDEMRAAAWQGAAADSYVAAHVPYLSWLAKAGTDSARAATQHATAAGAYVTALAGMPTQAELALNHSVHGALIATNFFGVNTIPIAASEADYVRMWIQAATVMAGYHAMAGAAVASMPTTDPAPPIRTAAPGLSGGDPTSPPDPPDPIDEANRWFWFIFWNVVFWSTFLFIVTIPVRIPIVLPLLIAGINQLIEQLQAQPEPALPAVEPAPLRPAAVMRSASNEPPLVAVGFGPAGTVAGTAGASTGATGPQATGPAVPLTGTEMLGFLVSGGYAEDFGPTLTGRGRDSAPAAGLAAVSAAGTPSAACVQARSRRRRRPIMREFGDQTMRLDARALVDPAVTATAASDHGAGPLGFTGTTSRSGAHSAGLTRLGGNIFDVAPQLPLLPDTWDRDAPDSPGRSPG